MVIKRVCIFVTHFPVLSLISGPGNKPEYMLQLCSVEFFSLLISILKREIQIGLKDISPSIHEYKKRDKKKEILGSKGDFFSLEFD